VWACENLLVPSAENASSIEFLSWHSMREPLSLGFGASTERSGAPLCLPVSFLTRCASFLCPKALRSCRSCASTVVPHSFARALIRRFPNSTLSLLACFFNCL
jgi:hypothetical protein